MIFPAALTGEEGTPSMKQLYGHRIYRLATCNVLRSKRDPEEPSGIRKWETRDCWRAGTVLSSDGSTPRLEFTCSTLPLQGCVGFELLSSASSLR